MSTACKARKGPYSIPRKECMAQVPLVRIAAADVTAVADRITGSMRILTGEDGGMYKSVNPRRTAVGMTERSKMSVVRSMILRILLRRLFVVVMDLDSIYQ